MAKKTISSNQLTPDTYYYVKGNVSFSRVGNHTSDKEREKFNKNRKYPLDKNYTTITINNARVMAKDPKNPTIEERYAAESLYTSSANNSGKCFTAINKSSTNLPEIRVMNSETGEYDKYDMKGKELDTGLEVIVGMRVFEGKGNIGVSLDHIIVTEPIRFFKNFKKNAAASAALEQLGLVFSVPTPNNETNENKETETADDNSVTESNPPSETNDPFSSMGDVADNEDDDDDNPFASSDSIGAGSKRTY